MKYFTKEWYELCQKTSFHLQLEEEKQAESFSDEYFKQLYNAELNSWVSLQEEIASILETSYRDDKYEYERFHKARVIEQFYDSFLFNQGHLKGNYQTRSYNRLLI